MSDPKREAMLEARALQRDGAIDAAAECCLAVGAVLEAASIFAGAKRYADAGRVLMARVGVPLEILSGAAAAQRSMALKAAAFLARGGEIQRAVQIFDALGETARAIEALEKVGETLEVDRIRTRGDTPADAGLPIGRDTARRLESTGQLDAALEAFVALRALDEAARVAKKLGNKALAVELYIEGGQPYEAALTCLTMGRPAEALDLYVQVPTDHRHYRSACMDALRIAAQLERFDAAIEVFIAEFVGTAPEDDFEVEVVYMLGQLYEEHGRLEWAAQSFQKVVDWAPGFTDAAARLAALAAPGPEPSVVSSVPIPPASARAALSIPELPALPALPDLVDVIEPVERPDPVDMRPPRVIPVGPIDPPGPFPPLPPLLERSRRRRRDDVAVFEVGAVIADRYRLDRILGRGGTAVVFEAFDLELGEAIALKVFQQPVHDDQLIARFKQELRLSRQLNHPNIIRLYDIGLYCGYRYISMELLVGRTLHELMFCPTAEELGTIFDLETGLDYLVQACDGLAAAHRKGVVHRDIKPANLFVTDEEMVKLMDFGIAKSQVGQGLTLEGLTAGTPEYMSPEQGRNFSEVSAASDLYSLGVTAYQMFTGTLPFTHCEVIPLLMMHANDEPEPPRLRNPDLPEVLDAIIVRLLRKDAATRFATAKALAAALQALRG